MGLWAVIVAAGSGRRFGSLKQVASFSGKRVVDHSIDPFRKICDGIVVVGSSSELGSVESLSVDFLVPGGENRSESVRQGLAVLPASASHVLIHDGARPLVSAALVDRVVAALQAGAEAVVPVIALSDTLRTVTGIPVNRSDYVAVQTPQGFELQMLRIAYSQGSEATDDAALVDNVADKVVHIEGDPSNMKITFPHDILIAEVLFNECR